MKNYKIRLKSTSAITQLPDSQKVFGALVTMFAKRNGNEKTTELVQAVYNKKIHLALSNVIPLDYFPMPQDYVVEMLAEVKEDLKKKRAEIKKRAYVREEAFQNIKYDMNSCSEIYPYIKLADEQQLRASVDSVRYGIEGLETRLYTVPTLKLIEVKDKNTILPVSEYCFYLQSNDSEILESILELIKELQQNETSIILGKRASQGLNKYRITDIEEINIKKTNQYLNLGMLLPNEIDFATSTLRLFTSQRRPFAMQGGWNQTCDKYFISFIDSGSIIALDNGVDKAGKCVRSPFNKERDIVFGNAFLYPFDKK